AADRIRDPVKGAAPARHVGSAEARQVGSDDMESIVEARNEVAEHMARTRKSVKQQELWGLRYARLPIEDLETIDVGRAIPDGGHSDAPLNDFRLSRLESRPGDRAQPGTAAAIASVPWRPDGRPLSFGEPGTMCVTPGVGAVMASVSPTPPS